ncbi:MAG: DUF4384 domain-containing protein [Candidatus Sumerlaeaceae bacterium]|nr:DUF4384 domain-containing protein [Candidatus Sumerlaeaceae bacterium]
MRLKFVAALSLTFWALTLFSPTLHAATVTEGAGAYKPRSGEREISDASSRVAIVPRPLDGILKVDISTDRTRYHIGDPIRIYFSVNRDAYVFIFNTDAAGVSRQIFPNYYDRDNFVRAGRQYMIPDRSYDLEVTGPPGTEKLTIVAVAQHFPFLDEWHNYSRRNPYPAARDGAAALVRRIESFRSEPPARETRAVRPIPRENFWAEDWTTFYVMGSDRYPPREYKVARYGRLEIDSQPGNARIYIDGEYYGRTPHIVDRIEVGYHSLRLEKNGYEPYQTNIYVRPNDTRRVDVFLKPVKPRPYYRWEGIGFFQRRGE